MGMCRPPFHLCQSGEYNTQATRTATTLPPQQTQRMSPHERTVARDRRAHKRPWPNAIVSIVRHRTDDNRGKPTPDMPVSGQTRDGCVTRSSLTHNGGGEGSTVITGLCSMHTRRRLTPRSDTAESLTVGGCENTLRAQRLEKFQLPGSHAPQGSHNRRAPSVFPTITQQRDVPTQTTLTVVRDRRAHG